MGKKMSYKGDIWCKGKVRFIGKIYLQHETQSSRHPLSIALRSSIARFTKHHQATFSNKGTFFLISLRICK